MMLDSVKAKAGELISGKQNNLQKAKIIVLSTKEELPCQFNPQELSITRSVSWYPKNFKALNSPVMFYLGASAATCQVNLVFDTTNTGDDVRMYTNQLLRMTMKGGGNYKKQDIMLPPPVVAFEWGQFKLFKAVITQLSITYNLFLPDGTPVRARANVTLMQNDHEDDIKSAQNPTTRTEPRKTRVVQIGERLDMIAYEEYGQAHYWRKLAEVNEIDHVESLKVGQVLIIPALD